MNNYSYFCIIQNGNKDMTIREKRQEAMRSVLNDHVVTSQVELLRVLKMVGYKMTQATLSRDLRQLHVAKISTPAGMRYILPGHPLYQRVDMIIDDEEEEMAKEQPQKLLAVKFSGNMAVLSTRAGYASALAAEIDEAKMICVVGTIAGDDTILVVLTEGTPHEDFKEALEEVLYEG